MKKLEVLDFTATWCSPCRAMLSTISSLSAEYNLPDSNVEIKKIDVDEDSFYQHQYQIRSVPTIVFVLDGVEMDRVRGLISKEDIKKKIELLQVQ